MSNHLKAALVLTAVFLLSSGCQTNGKKSNPDLSSKESKFSYAIGLDIAGSLKNISENTELDYDIITAAIKDALVKNNPRLEPEEAKSIKDEIFAKMKQDMEASRKAASAKNIEEGEKFLTENKAREGVKTTESGLQYEVIEEGSGNTPKETDKVKVHYKGMTLDNEVFDDSYSRGEPATFKLNQVIPGWREGLQLMKTGAKYKLYVPSKLGYGERGAGKKIEPNSTLIFEIELLDIVE